MGVVAEVFKAAAVSRRGRARAAVMLCSLPRFVVAVAGAIERRPAFAGVVVFVFPFFGGMTFEYAFSKALSVVLLLSRRLVSRKSRRAKWDDVWASASLAHLAS